MRTADLVIQHRPTNAAAANSSYLGMVLGSMLTAQPASDVVAGSLETPSVCLSATTLSNGGCLGRV